MPAKKAAPKKRGRPSGFDPKCIAIAARACELGATDVDLAHLFAVEPSTIHRWAVRYPDFRSALKAGKSKADERVERSLYERAVGYSYESEKLFFDKAQPAPKRGEADKRVVRAKILEHVPPDTTAQIFWLKNRHPEAWRDVHKIENTHRFEDADKISDAELLRIAMGHDDEPKASAQGGDTCH